ncbi:hypothetical protein [Streptomyces sennicomposti]
MSMSQLVAAGAPELPEGCFYRVRSNGLCLEVQVRERRKRFGSVVRALAYVRPDEPDGLTAIVGACVHAVRRMEEQESNWLAALDATQYIGDHDPKGGR